MPSLIPVPAMPVSSVMRSLLGVDGLGEVRGELRPRLGGVGDHAGAGGLRGGALHGLLAGDDLEGALPEVPVPALVLARDGAGVALLDEQADEVADRHR